MGWFSRRQPPSASFTTVSWDTLDLGYRATIRGESHYQPQLRALQRRSREWTAVLVREPGNRYDPNAVAVHIDGQCIGHLAREDAAELAPRLDALLRGRVLVTFDALLCGGDRERPNIGVFQN